VIRKLQYVLLSFRYAYVSLNDILQENADIVEEEILIFDAENTRVEIGVMCVSVQALKAIKDL